MLPGINIAIGAPLRFAVYATLSLEAHVFNPQCDPPWLSSVHTGLEVSMADMPHITDIIYLAPTNSISICAVWHLQVMVYSYGTQTYTCIRGVPTAWDTQNF
jgi:hypothetical protein